MATQSYLLFVISFALIPFTCFAVTYAPLYVFGDGFYDSGNTYFLGADADVPSHFPPYGMTHFNRPTGRFCDGRLIPDWIAVQMSRPFFRPALNQSADHSYGSNFAVYGAGVFDYNYNDLSTLSFAKQVRTFQKSDATGSNVKTAVYLINIGVNDYVQFMNKNPSVTETELQEFVDSVIAELKKHIQRLHASGGMKFMFQNLPPIGCIPTIKKSDDCTEDTLSKLAALHNTALIQLAQDLKNTLLGVFEFSIFDYNKMFTQMMNDPSRYGIKHVDKVCCKRCSANYGIRRIRAEVRETGILGRHAKVGATDVCTNPSEYMFFDGWHHTDNINFAFGGEMWWGHTFVSPLNLQNLFLLDTTSGNTKLCSPADNCRL